MSKPAKLKPGLIAEAFKATADAKPEDFGIHFDNDKWVTLDWGGRKYSHEIGHIATPAQLLGLVHHVSGKNWPGMTAQHLHWLIEFVAERRKISMY